MNNLEKKQTAVENKPLKHVKKFWTQNLLCCCLVRCDSDMTARNYFTKLVLNSY